MSSRSLRILALEPYAAGSHRQFLEGLAEHSSHRIDLALLPARKWKWRMRTAALHYAELIAALPELPDLLFASDYLNLQELVALRPDLQPVPKVIYFHENQLTYPLQDHEELDYHHAFTHLYSMLVADRVLFNSEYHRRSWFDRLPWLIDQVPDMDLTSWIERAAARSQVLPLGLDQPVGRVPADPVELPIVLWNHRFEYDKNPRALLHCLLELDAEGANFGLCLRGERFRTAPPEFRQLTDRLGHRIVEDGYAPGRPEYLATFRRCHVVLSTAIHEFFGLGTLEAIRGGCAPVLPDDLAYPELIPDELHPDFLYPRADGPTPLLRKMLARVESGSDLDRRQQLIDSTERFAWTQLAPRYDELFSDLAAP